jgi:hypothetical protein
MHGIVNKSLILIIKKGLSPSIALKKYKIPE